MKNTIQEMIENARKAGKGFTYLHEITDSQTRKESLSIGSPSLDSQFIMEIESTTELNPKEVIYQNLHSITGFGAVLVHDFDLKQVDNEYQVSARYIPLKKIGKNEVFNLDGEERNETHMIEINSSRKGDMFVYSLRKFHPESKLF